MIGRNQVTPSLPSPSGAYTKSFGLFVKLFSRKEEFDPPSLCSRAFCSFSTDRGRLHFTKSALHAPPLYNDSCFDDLVDTISTRLWDSTHLARDTSATHNGQSAGTRDPPMVNGVQVVAHA